MPSHKSHRLLHPESYNYVDEWKDAPSKTLGRAHRIVRHDHTSNLALAIKAHDPNAFLYGEVHDALDMAVSKAKTDLSRRTSIPRWLIDQMVKI